jgi:hypothetical protein
MRTAISVTDKAHNRHDIILVWLVRDASQWAYLAAVPSVWAADTLASSVKAGNKLWAPNGVDALSLRIHGRQAINDKFKELFLTANEIKENA